MKPPRTHRLKDEDISGEVCKCNHCGITQKCTLQDDFYTLSFIKYKEDEPRPLYCENCVWVENSLYEKKKK